MPGLGLEDLRKGDSMLSKAEMTQEGVRGSGAKKGSVQGPLPVQDSVTYRINRAAQANLEEAPWREREEPFGAVRKAKCCLLSVRPSWDGFLRFGQWSWETSGRVEGPPGYRCML